MTTAYINGHVITVNQGFETAEAFLVEGDSFGMVGTTEEILKELEKRKTENGEEIPVRDLGGKTVLPGFNDSHLHLLNYAYGLSKFPVQRRFLHRRYD